MKKHVSRRVAIGAGLAGVMLPGAAWPWGQERQSEGGIGGTGIVGIATEAGALVVAGSALATDGLTRVTDGFGRIALSDIARGDSLTVEAAGATDALTARRIHVTHPLVGAVERIAADGKTLRVNGTDVRVARAMAIRIGDRVAVSGLWRGVDVVASAVRPTDQPLDLISGAVARQSAEVRIGGTLLRGRGQQALVDGSFATATGQYDAARGAFEAARSVSQRFTGAAGPLVRLAIEGYLEPVPTAPGYTVSGLGHSFARNLDLAPYVGTRVLFRGGYTGKFAATEALRLPENAEERRAILRSLTL